MRSTLSLLLTFAFLLPSGACLCAAEAVPALRQVPAVKIAAAKGCKKCGHCRVQAEQTETPGRDHTPGCPAIVKVDSIRSVDVSAAIDLLPQPTDSILLNNSPSPAATFPAGVARGTDPPKRLLFCTLLI